MIFAIISELNRCLGTELSQDRIVTILESLELKITFKGSGIHVDVSTYRSTKDIEYKADFIEEIGRITGYDNIPPESPSYTVHAVRLSKEKAVIRNIQDFLVLHGKALEVMTHPIEDKCLLDKTDWPGKAGKIVLGISMIKLAIARTLQKMVDRVIQVYGGLGMTDDTILHISIAMNVQQ